MLPIYSNFDGYTSSEDSSDNEETTPSFNAVWKEILTAVPKANNSEHKERNIKQIVFNLVVRDSFNLQSANKVFKTAYKSVKTDVKFDKKENEIRYVDCRSVYFSCIVKFFLLQKTSSDMYEGMLPATYHDMPAFRKISSSSEPFLLIRFRHVARVALSLIPAEKNKILLMSVCGLLEGGGKRYVTGGEPSMETQRREIIFNTEGEYAPIPRPERRAAMSSAPKKDKKRKSVHIDISSDSEISTDGDRGTRSRSSSFDSLTSYDSHCESPFKCSRLYPSTPYDADQLDILNATAELGDCTSQDDNWDTESEGALFYGGEEVLMECTSEVCIPQLVRVDTIELMDELEDLFDFRELDLHFVGAGC